MESLEQELAISTVEGTEQADGEKTEFLPVPHLVVLGIAAAVLVVINLPFAAGLADKLSFLMSFFSYSVVIIILAVLQLGTLLIRKLRPYTIILTFLLLLACGYAAAEMVYRIHPLSAKAWQGVLGAKTVTHLNYFFLHRLYHLIPLAAILTLYFTFPARYYPRYFKFGDLSVTTSILDKNKPITWKNVLVRFSVWVSVIFILLLGYSLAKHHFKLSIPPAIIGALLLYAWWNCFIEETLFRGVLHSAFSYPLPPETANFLQAFLFGLVHVDPFNIPISIVKVVLFTFLGWFFGRAARETGGIGTSYLMHSMLVTGIELRLLI